MSTATGEVKAGRAYVEILLDQDIADISGELFAGEF